MCAWRTGVAFGTATACPAGRLERRAFKRKSGEKASGRLFAGGIGVLAGSGRPAGDPEIPGLGVAISEGKAFRRQAALQKLADRRGAAGHAALKAPIVQRLQLFPG